MKMFCHSHLPLPLSLIHSFIHSFVHSFIPSFLPSFLHSFIHSFHSIYFIHSFIHSFNSIPFHSISFIHSFINSFIHRKLDSPSLWTFCFIHVTDITCRYKIHRFIGSITIPIDSTSPHATYENERTLHQVAVGSTEN